MLRMKKGKFKDSIQKIKDSFIEMKGYMSKQRLNMGKMCKYVLKCF